VRWASVSNEKTGVVEKDIEGIIKSINGIADEEMRYAKGMVIEF